jgi:hypothetical protein
VRACENGLWSAGIWKTVRFGKHTDTQVLKKSRTVSRIPELPQKNVATSG